MPNPAAAVDALGTAWTVFNLYPDPADQPAFRRAIEHLQAASQDGLRVDVEATGFQVGDEPVAVDREGASRLAAQCFLQKILTVSVTPDVSAEDVARFFRILNQDQADVVRGGGVGTALRRDGVIALAVAQRGALAESAGEVHSRPDFVQAIVDSVEQPERLAAQLASAGSPDDVAEALVGGYRDALEALDASDTDGRERVVQAFVEAFFHLEPAAQDAAFVEFLSSDQLADRAFLDQFAGHELAAMAPRLDSKGLTLLLDYAKVATDQADERPAELISILSDTDAIMSARRLAASKIHDRLAEMRTSQPSSDGAVASLRAQVPDPKTYFARGLHGFRTLLALETRPDRFERILRSWGAAVATEVDAGQFGRAGAWFDALMRDPVYSGRMADSVAETIAATVDSDLITRTVQSDGREARDFLRRLARHAMIPVIDALAEQEDASQRRRLLDSLTEVARENPSVIVSRLGDDRWYVVRNLVAALRNVDAPEVIGAIRRLLEHPEPRVRVEALRAVARRGDDVLPALRRALGDEDNRVREAAIALLGDMADPVAHRALVAAASERARPVAERVRSIGALSIRPSPVSTEFLERMAARRFVFGSASRQIRAAARNSLRAARSG